MKIKVLILFLFVTTISLGQTTIKDGEEVSGTWRKSGSPYTIEGEAIIPEGKVLKIKPGVIVEFKVGENRDYRLSGDKNPDFDLGFLRVKGQLKAKGKKNKPVVFTRAYNYGFWGNVFFENSSDNTLKYCNFHYAYYMRSVTEDDNGTGAVSFYKSDAEVEHCVFADNGWTAVNCKQGSSPTFKNLTILRNQYAVECNTNSKPTIINSIIWDNENGFYINGGGKAILSYCLVQGSSLPSGAYSSNKVIMGKDPKVDTDFTLDKNSPCLNAGKDGANIGAERK